MSFAVACKVSSLIFLQNTVVAFSLKNSTCHIEPFSNSGNRWVTKLVDFLKIEDYLVEGYSQPSIDAEIHVHLASTTLACSHLDSETSLKLFFVLLLFLAFVGYSLKH